MGEIMPHGNVFQRELNQVIDNSFKKLILKEKYVL